MGLTYLAVVTLPAVRADALVHADLVDAGAAVVARVALAVVDVWNEGSRVRFLRGSCRRWLRGDPGLTLMTVSASEALLALAGELAPCLAPAAAVGSTHV